MIARWLLAFLLFSCGASAQEARPEARPELRVGVQAPFVLDPHLLFYGPNMAAARYIFDSLVGRDADAHWTPALAERWEQTDPTTWVFHLRRGVVFQDGSPFTAADVLASFKRIPAIPNNPSPYTPNLRTIVRTDAPDPHTLVVHTDGPNPTLPGQFTNIFIIPAHLADKPAEGGTAAVAVGTGPYKLTEFRYGEGMVLARSDTYWGAKPAYPSIRIRVIPNDAAREAALLSGDIDLMENVPPDDVARLRADKGITVFSRPADRVVFLLPNVAPARLAQATAKDGTPLAANPLRDLRVRQAISLAIDRPALVARVLAGQGVPTMQLVPEGFAGYTAALPVPRPDPAAARKLLAEAGFPDGFKLTLACTNDRYIYDARMCQVLAQMLSRAGIQTAVDAMPGSLFMARTVPGKNETALMMYAISLSSLRDASYILAMAHTPAEPNFIGGRGGFSDPGVDRAIEAASVLSGPDRQPALEAAQQAAIGQLAMIPLYNEPTIAAARAGIEYTPRIDQQFVATSARPKDLP